MTTSNIEHVQACAYMRRAMKTFVCYHFKHFVYSLIAYTSNQTSQTDSIIIIVWIIISTFNIQYVRFIKIHFESYVRFIKIHLNRIEEITIELALENNDPYVARSK